jgi:signal peptidase II
MTHGRGETQAFASALDARRALNGARRPAISRAMLRFGLILAAVVVVADQIAKYIVLGPAGFSPPGCLENGYNCRVIEVLPFFDLRMVWNRGVSFGLMRANTDIVRWALVALSFVISGVFVSWLRTAERRVTAVALGLVVGGAIGNVIDRIRFGAVCDFFDFSGLWFPWVFNVGDAAITVGAILLAVDMVFFAETEPGKGAPWRQFRSRFGASGAGSGRSDR